MEYEKRKKLESLGWSPEMLDSLGRTAEHESVDKMFRDRTERALSAIGCTALEFLAANPCVSTKELAKRLNRGASAIGVTIAVYEEAVEQGVVRAVAKNMIIRFLLSEFPGGWSMRGDIHPLVKIGSWHSEVADYAADAAFGQYAERIIRSLTIDKPPYEGWRPLCPDDPLIDELFASYWPIQKDS